MASGQRAGSSLSPLILRLALAVIFLWFGLPKVKMADFTGESAQRLIALGVAAGSTTGESVAAGEEGAVEDADEAANGSGATVRALGLHHITLMLDKAGHPMPVVFGWLAAVSEVGGGVAMFVGLLTRLAGLGLATAMGYAFWFTSYPALATAAGANGSISPNVMQALGAVGKLDFGAQSTLFFQMALFAMAMAVVFSGAGRLSLDAALFRRGGGGAGAGAKKSGGEG